MSEAATAGGSTPPWRVRVGSAAVRDCGPMLDVQWLACGAVLARAHAQLFLQLPEPVGVRIGGVARLAPAGDLATLAGLDEPSSGSLTATVDFRDPESGDLDPDANPNPHPNPEP